MHRFFDLANAITLISLLSAAGSIFLAMNERFAAANVALIIAGLCDLFDGFVARRLKRTEEQQRFGGRLDSLVDACSFGLAPAVLLYASGLKQPFDLPLLGIFTVCAIWRLAYFDTVGLESEGRVRYFIGLPTTYVALVLPLVFLTALIGTNVFFIAIRIAVVVLAAALVSSFRVRKPGGLAYGFFLLLAVAVVSILIVNAPLLHSRLHA